MPIQITRSWNKFGLCIVFLGLREDIELVASSKKFEQAADLESSGDYVYNQAPMEYLINLLAK